MHTEVFTKPQRIIQLALGVLLLVFVCLGLRFNQLGHNIINFLAPTILFYGLDHFVIFYRCYVEESGYEVLATFVAFSLFTLGQMFQISNKSENQLLVNKICFFFLLCVLALNLLYFLVMVLIIFAYFFRHLYRLMTDRLINPNQNTEQNVLRTLNAQAKQFQQIQDQVSNVNTMCSICFENFKNDDICIILPQCQHCFHQDCIVGWLQNKATCPYCRNNINLSFI